MLSRFDLIYLVLDQPNEANDRRLAKHLISLYYEHPPILKHNTIPLKDFIDYITCTRLKIHPKLTDEAANLLIENYVKIGIDQDEANKEFTYCYCIN